MSNNIEDIMQFYQNYFQQKKSSGIQLSFGQTISDDFLFPFSQQHYCQMSDYRQVTTKFGQDQIDFDQSLQNTLPSTNGTVEKFIELDDQKNVEAITSLSNTQKLFNVNLQNQPQYVSANYSQEQLSSNNQRSKISKHKKITKLKTNYSQAQLSSNGTISKQKKIKKPNRYPTKNFLPKFKHGILGYLEDHVVNYESYEFLKKIQEKKGISMQDYEDIFTEPDFQAILEKMFRQRHFYRVFVTSRIQLKQKIKLVNKIHVFEFAFKRGKFMNIN